ncbi:pre-peptidase C-terminal domain-containing protein [Kribbella sp. NPDC058245]|uniref:pre-peptidase C-terminal domain-containing protein n=1 Tax=Kribbella sp. NPDC058245 TaxID=3346399 RepID=UPI0036E3F0AB
MTERIHRTVVGVALVAALLATTPAVSSAVGTTTDHQEHEAVTAAGENDSRTAAERLYGVGTGYGQSGTATVHGTLSPAPVALTTGDEDNGSIALATATGIGTGAVRAVTTSGTLGDGPHGVLGDKTNDFDFYKVAGVAGQTLTVSTDGSAASTNTVVGVYDAAGQLLASDDDSGAGALSKLQYPITAVGDYYVAVAGKSALGDFPADAQNSGSGLGGADTGAYQVLIASAPIDRDFYAVKLAAGDVLGAALTATGDRLTVLRPNGSVAVGTDLHSLGKLPAASTLPRGAVDLAVVADQAGWYAVSVTDGFGAYDLNLGVTRPGVDTTPQTVFLDFDGGSIDLAPLGGTGVRQLSGLASYLPNWGLTATDEAAVIAKATAVVKENLRTDAVRAGYDVNVSIRNSADSTDTFGSPNVSRVVIGGKTSESGIGRVGTAQSIDVGNFAHEETVLVQLDRISAATGPLSLNTYLSTTSNRIAFVGTALGNLASRELGALYGAAPADPASTTSTLMDADSNFPGLYGVGADGLGGTADDVDVDFTSDAYNPATGLTGSQNALNAIGWGISFPC